MPTHSSQRERTHLRLPPCIAATPLSSRMLTPPLLGPTPQAFRDLRQEAEDQGRYVLKTGSKRAAAEPKGVRTNIHLARAVSAHMETRYLCDAVGAGADASARLMPFILCVCAPSSPSAGGHAARARAGCVRWEAAPQRHLARSSRRCLRTVCVKILPKPQIKSDLFAPRSIGAPKAPSIRVQSRRTPRYTPGRGARALSPQQVRRGAGVRDRLFAAQGACHVSGAAWRADCRVICATYDRQGQGRPTPCSGPRRGGAGARGFAIPH